jgi:hypothetical protein
MGQGTLWGYSCGKTSRTGDTVRKCLLHASAHQPIIVPGYRESDALSKIRAGRVHAPGVTWLHETLGHMGAQPMAARGPQTGVTTTIAEVQEACNACLKLLQRVP